MGYGHGSTDMFGIGPMEAIIIALVAVIFVGPDKLPGVLKKFGRFYVQAKRHANDVKSSFDSAIHEAERDLELEKIRELQRQIQESTNLANILDAEHQDKSQAALPSGDDGHTPDGRLIEAPSHP
ncbi:MAG: twin-arginine translocase subunit TatB, partial [Flavobacteriales bacterium]